MGCYVSCHKPSISTDADVSWSLMVFETKLFSKNLTKFSINSDLESLESVHVVLINTSGT